MTLLARSSLTPLALIAAVSLLGSFAAAGHCHAGSLLSPAEQNRAVRQLDDRPMVFFVAKGSADACGTGCREWIAAEGRIVSGSADRLKEFLGRLDGRELPIFFHSRGGSGADALRIGLLLRERRMFAGVGRTIPAQCRVFSKDDSACQRMIGAVLAVEAHLLPNEGQCHSGCVYAFLGGSSRRLGSGARLGVHAARLVAASNPARIEGRAKTPAAAILDIQRSVRRYLIELGVDPKLADLAATIGPNRLYVLSRDDIVRFGIETNGAYETPWTALSESSATPFVMKSRSIPQASNDRELRTSSIGLQCFAGQVWLLLRQEASARSDDAATAARISLGSRELLLHRLPTKRTGDQLYAAPVGHDFVRDAQAASKIVTTPVQGSQEMTADAVTFSSNELSAAAGKLQQACSVLPLAPGPLQRN
jgi:hypothetical protein